MRTAVYQPSYLAGLSGQESYPLHAIRRENTIQGFGFGEVIRRKFHCVDVMKYLRERYSLNYRNIL